MKKENVSKIYDFLQANDFIGPGQIIPVETLKELFQCKDQDSLEYVGPMILLMKEILRVTGYYCRSMDKNLHICTDDEKAYLSEKMRLKTERILKEAEHGLKNTDLTKISDQSKREAHNHQLNLLLTLNKQSRLILDNLSGLEN